MSLFTSHRERRLWIWVAVVMVAIYSSLGPSQVLAEWLRERNLLRISLGAALFLVATIVMWRWVKTRPGWREIGVGFGVTFAYLWALTRVSVPPEERTHLIEYAVVAAFMYQALVERRRNGRTVPAPDALTVLGTALLGWLDEGIQWLLPNRVFDIRDVFFNFLAGVMFMFVALCIALVRRRKPVVDPPGARWPDTLLRRAIVPRLAVLAIPLGIAAYVGFGPQPSLQQLATEYTAAWNSQDAASVAAHYTDNGSLTINEGTPSVGREAITAAAQGFMTAFPDMVVTMDSVSAAGDYTLYFWTLTGTNIGPGGTGNAVRISGHEEWTIGSDGLILKSQGHYDEAEYQRQLESGVTPGR